MRISKGLLLALLIAWVAPAALAQETTSDEEIAADVAELWVAQIDTSAYAESWQTAAPLVQEGVTEEQWVTAVDQVRSQVGPIVERSLQDSQYRTSLPNAPDGEYVVLQYVSAFERLPQAVEMIVMMKTDDGAWKTAGYQVAPMQQQE